MTALDSEIQDKLREIAQELGAMAAQAILAGHERVRIDMDPYTAQALAVAIGSIPEMAKSMRTTMGILAAMCVRYTGNTVHLGLQDAQWIKAYMDGDITIQQSDDPVTFVKTLKVVHSTPQNGRVS